MNNSKKVDMNEVRNKKKDLNFLIFHSNPFAAIKNLIMNFCFVKKDGGKRI